MNTMTKEEFDRMIDRHFQFEAENDVDGVLSTMIEDVQHDVVGSPTGPLHGQQAARGFYDALFADLSGERVTTLRRYYGPDFVVDESLWEGSAPGTPFGVPGRGRQLAFRLLHVFEMAPEGKIKRENVWIDLASIMHQLQVSPSETGAMA